MNTFGFKLVASNALKIKYGFGPAPDQITLPESDGDGNYILFRVGEHEYRYEDDEITNIEEQKKLDAELSANVELLRMRQRDMDELRKSCAKQEKQFITKELMLTEAYNAKRMEIEDLKGRLRLLQTLADDRKKEIERLETENSEMKKTLHYRDLALDKAAAKRDELETKNRQLCNDLAGERLMVRNLETQLEERAAEHAAVEAAGRTAAYRAARLED